MDTRALVLHPVVIWFTSMGWLLLLYLLVINIPLILNLDQELDQSPFLILLVFLILVSGQLLIIKRLSHARRVSLFPFWIRSKKQLKIGPIVILTQHHPPEQYLDAHELNIFGNQVCSGCYGTILGIIIGLILLSILGLFPPAPASGNLPLMLYASGVIFVQLSFSKYLLPLMLNKEPTGAFRLLLNASLPIGINLMLVSIYVSQQSVVLTLLTLFGLAVPLAFRLLFAQVDHTQLEGTHAPGIISKRH